MKSVAQFAYQCERTPQIVMFEGSFFYIVIYPGRIFFSVPSLDRAGGVKHWLLEFLCLGVGEAHSRLSKHAHLSVATARVTPDKDFILMLLRMDGWIEVFPHEPTPP